MIRLENVDRRYTSGEVETTALKGIDLVVAKSEFIAIMGPSGCGKSTLLNTIGTIDRPSSGRYVFDDLELTALSEAELARFRAANLGFVFQSFNLIDELTIEENVALGLTYRKRDKSNDAERVAAALDTVGVAHRARHYPSQLSGGQQQRTAIARAIVGQPNLVLADEPTGNLDTANGDQIMQLLSDLNEGGATIIMVTHSASDAAIAKRRIKMLDGRIVDSKAGFADLSSRQR